MINKKNIAVIFGGCSPEYSVSLESASSIIRHMDTEKFNPVLVGITQQGDWYYFTGSASQIANHTWTQNSCTPACISPNRSNHELLVFQKNWISRIHLDAVLPVLHGRNGEDGTVQGLCELAGIPLVGCSTLASALCMDKDRAHKLVYLEGVQVPRSFVFSNGYDRKEISQKAKELGYPLFVKPVKAGSSYGISKVTDPAMLFNAIDTASYYDESIILEEAIAGFEVGCAVMGRDKLFVGEPDEIELFSGFFDFKEKYNLVTAKIHVPAHITPDQIAEIKATAKTIYRTLDCKGFARVDMFLTPDGTIVFNEVNTIPGFTPHSRFPNMMQAAGLNFSQIITRIIEEALE